MRSRAPREVPCCLLGDHKAAAAYQKLGFQMLGCGSDLSIMSAGQSALACSA